MGLAAIQSARLDERLTRELGTAVLAALDDPDVIEIILNPDGKIWLESHTQGMSETDVSMQPAQAENLIGTVAAIGSRVRACQPLNLLMPRFS